jgi:RNase P/RNase MRP subunit p29
VAFQQECGTVLRCAEKSDEDVLIMKNNMNTTLEIPEGSKATIQGKVIDGCYLLARQI